MMSRLITFGIGVYTGIYIQQTYNIPPVDDPASLWEKIKDFADKHRKKDN